MTPFNLDDVVRNVSRETRAKLEKFAEIVRAESSRQNLVSRSSLDSLWTRHVLDSAQLVRFAKGGTGKWLDIGSGAGFPGIVVAIMGSHPVTMVEPRRLRVEFLQRCIEELRIDAQVVQGRAESLTGAFDVISARAVASLSNLLDISQHLSTRKTLWVFPKGKSAASELEEARKAWHAEFHVEQSITDPDSSIILARNVRRRSK